MFNALKNIRFNLGLKDSALVNIIIKIKADNSLKTSGQRSLKFRKIGFTPPNTTFSIPNFS
ncbi:MAG: hypothetical protein ACI9RO_000615 [Alteromonas macleodii]|jgi:hypothetical protein